MQGLTQVRPIDPLVTGFGLKFIQTQDAYIADDVAPVIGSNGDTGTYFIWEPANLFRIENTAWSNNGGAPRVDMRATKDAYLCLKYGLEIPVSDDDRRNSLDPVGLERRATERITRGMILDRENRVATTITNLTISDGVNGISSLTAPAGGTRWSGTTADPRGNIDTGKQQMLKQIGVLPNTLILGADSYFDIVKNNTTGTAGAIIKAAIQYVLATTANNINPALVAQFFDIERVLVGWGIKDTSNEGKTIQSARLQSEAAAASGDYMWKNLGLLAYIDPNPGQDSMQFYSTFASVPFIGDRYREDQTESDILRVKQVLVEKQVCRAAGFLIKPLTT